jgi:hypothetical protein
MSVTTEQERKKERNQAIIEPLQIFGLIGFLFWFDLEFGKN